MISIDLRVTALLILLVVTCGESRGQRPAPGGNQQLLETHRVGAISFRLQRGWLTSRTNTPATKLFLLWTREESIQGGVDGVVKVDVGQPIEPTLEGSAKAIATRFDGELTWLADRPIAWIQTRSTTIDLPRHCFTASVDDEVYFVFLASNGPAIADQAAIAVRESLRLASVPPTSSTRKASVEQLRSSNRTWADSTGRHKVNARLVRLDNDVVTLRKANGREVTLPFDRLSDEDRTLLEDARDAPENLSE